MNRVGRILILSSAVLALAIPFSNCTRQSINSSGTTTTYASGGDSYDGKPDPGDYYRVIPQYQCAPIVEAPEKIVVSDQSVSITETAANCSQSTRTINLTDLAFSAFNRGMVGYASGIFQKLASAPTPVLPAETIEAVCRLSGASVFSGRDAVIKANRASKVLRAEILSTTGVDAVAAVTRSTSAGAVSYSAAGFALAINGLATTGTVFSGTLTRSGQTYTMDCRMGSGLDVVAPSNAPAMAFNILGVLGGSDANADAFLSDWSGRTVVWQKLDSALTNVAAIYDATNTNLVCPAVTSNSDRATLTCALQPGTSYTIRVTTSTVYGNNYLASNQNLSFSVSPVSASNLSHAPSPVRAGQIVTFSADITSSVALTDTHVHFIVYDANWNVLPNEIITNNENFAPNVTRNFVGNYQLPATAGTYHMQVHVFSTDYATRFIQSSNGVNYTFQVDP